MGVSPGGVARLHVLVHSKNFDEEKLGKVERKVEPEKTTAATSGRLSENCGTVVSFFLFVPYAGDDDRRDYDYDHDEDNDYHRDNGEDGDDHDVRRSSAGGRCSSCPN